MRIALATWRELPALSDDDRELVDALRALGVGAVGAVWDDPAIRWDEFDAVVIRSTWDYYLRLAEFLGWIDRVSGVTILHNNARTVRWNSHKSYLHALERSGVPIVPTRICRDAAEVRAVLRAEGWERAVVKPAVSAGGYRTFLARSDTSVDALFRGPEAVPPGEVLVQPYLEEVERAGERSIVFLAGRFSHAFLRAPKLAPRSPLAEATTVQVTEAEIRLAASAIAAAPGPPLYARVDLVPDREATARLMELELIEPFLALKTLASAAPTFARAIVGADGDAPTPPPRPDRRASR